MYFSSFVDEFCKVAARPITEDEAHRALERLNYMEQQRDFGALGRAAGVGAAIMPVANVFARGIAGKQPFLRQGQKFTMNPVQLAKRMDWGSIGRHAAADSSMGAFFGGALPLAREYVESGAQKAKLEDYLDQQQQPTTFRRHIQRNVGL